MAALFTIVIDRLGKPTLPRAGRSTIASRRLSLKPDPQIDYWQIGLDMAAKPLVILDAAFSPNGSWLTIAAGGTHELLIFQNSAIPWNSGDPGDTIDSMLCLDDGKLRRLPLGGRPVAVQFVEESETAVVANYLLDAVQIVDVNAGKLVRQVQLGGPLHPDLNRKGEIIFYDAKRSHHQWFSCHSCHPDGHTSAYIRHPQRRFYGNPKLTPTLRGVAHTGPWTWHGWQKQLSSGGKIAYRYTFRTQANRRRCSCFDGFPRDARLSSNPNRRADGSLTEAARAVSRYSKAKLVAFNAIVASITRPLAPMM